MATRKMRMYEVLENLQEKDVAALWIGRFLTVLIVVSVLGVIFDTVKSLHAAYASTFYAVEAFCVAVFSVEYILRVWCCTVHPAYRHPVWGRLRYMCTPMMLIDLVSILPFFLPFLLHDLGFVRVLRLFRLFRLLKLVRYSESLLSLRNVLVDRREDLGITFVTEADNGARRPKGVSRLVSHGVSTPVVSRWFFCSFVFFEKTVAFRYVSAYLSFC